MVNDPNGLLNRPRESMRELYYGDCIFSHKMGLQEGTELPWKEGNDEGDQFMQFLQEGFKDSPFIFI